MNVMPNGKMESTSIADLLYDFRWRFEMSSPIAA